MNTQITLNSLADMSLENAERIAFEAADIHLSEEAKVHIAKGRARFEAYMDKVSGYVYGSTTAPGARAKSILSSAQVEKQAETLKGYHARRPGLGGVMLPPRCVRLAIFARLTNAMTGSSKLCADTAQAIAELMQSPPPVPLQGIACSGEVMPMGWLLAPLWDRKLLVGEGMALVNGSPFASAMVSDVALTFKRRLRLAELVFAFSAEAAWCPLEYFDVRLSHGWPDPFYAKSLQRFAAIFEASNRPHIPHQTPVSWRVIPNLMASGWQALDEATQAANISLQSLKDNPTFLRGSDDEGMEADAIVSNAGYHDHRAARAIDQVNSVILDLCAMASRQVARFLDGEGLGLPPMLAIDGDTPGLESLAWTLTEPMTAARQAAMPTSIDMGLHDPAGNQSDVTSLAFIAYGKHRVAARALDNCLAALAMTSVLAHGIRKSDLPPKLATFSAIFQQMALSVPLRADVTSEPLRQANAFLARCAEEFSCADFQALVGAEPTM